MDANCIYRHSSGSGDSTKSAVAAMCVQLVDASDNLAIHMLTRILLRSSSTHEPSDPPLEVVKNNYHRLKAFGAHDGHSSATGSSAPIHPPPPTNQLHDKQGEHHT